MIWFFVTLLIWLLNGYYLGSFVFYSFFSFLCRGWFEFHSIRRRSIFNFNHGSCCIFVVNFWFLLNLCMLILIYPNSAVDGGNSPCTSSIAFGSCGWWTHLCQCKTIPWNPQKATVTGKARGSKQTHKTSQGICFMYVNILAFIFLCS